MTRIWIFALFLSFVSFSSAADSSARLLIDGLQRPSATAVGGDGRVYITVQGEIGKDGDGSVIVLDKGKPVTVAKGLDDPTSLVAFRDLLFVADRNRVWRIERNGTARIFAAREAFSASMSSLADLIVDSESGTLYASDPGDGKEKAGALYRITSTPKGAVVAEIKAIPGLQSPRGLALDSAVHLLVADAATGKLLRVPTTGGAAEEIASGLGSGDTLTWDRHGHLFIVDRAGQRLLAINRPGDTPTIAATATGTTDLGLDAPGKAFLHVDSRAGTVTARTPVVPGAEIDESPLSLEPTIAFPDLKWSGWEPQSEKGLATPLRPIVLTHAGDGSQRVFVATQHGVIHTFPDDQKATQTQVYLDLQSRVRYSDKSNEEGFLGLAFHPRYKENGELYVFYTPKKAKAPHTNLLSRFRVRKDDPTRADPASEEILLVIEHPFWNHDGGTVAFGPDGFLYLALGDGGAANDPFDNAQNLKTLLGSVLRLDVDRKEGDKPYAIPRDNPFVGRSDALPEIWAYGLRNVWRFSFDRKTGRCWAADVGQNLWEEINLLTKGGNYGWNRREGLHPFGVKGGGPRKELIDPIWEYHHDTGKSITGGHVYRGKLLPELEGSYLYADYVSGALWALRYDEAKGRVVANRPLRSRNHPVLSFGEDEKGEVYYLIEARTGQGIYRFVPTRK